MRTGAGYPPRPLLAAFREEERLLPPEAVRPVPGIPETLEILRQGGGHHYLVTHRDGLARAYLRANGLEGMFTDVITSESGFPRKPAPDSLLHLIAGAWPAAGSLRDDWRPSPGCGGGRQRRHAGMPAGRGGTI